MLKSRKAQGLSITTIIVAIIGLIILVVLIAIFTGRTNIYSSNVDELTSCKNTCKNIGYDIGSSVSENFCLKVSNPKGNPLPGTYSDVSGKDEGGRKLICCCLNKVG